MVSMYVSLTRVCCTLVPKICVCPEMLRLFLYMYVNVVHMRDCQLKTLKIIDKGRYM